MSIQQEQIAAELAEKFPRDVSEYEASAHFKQQFKWRNMDGDWIPELILEGALEAAKDGDENAAIFRKDIFCYDWVLAVQHVEDGPNIVKTAFVPGFEKADYDRCFGGR